MEKGDNVNIRRGTDTFLTMTVKCRNFDSVKYLLDHGAKDYSGVFDDALGAAVRRGMWIR